MGLQSWRAALEVDGSFWKIFGTCCIFEQNWQSLFSLLANSTLVLVPYKRGIDRLYAGHRCLRGSPLGRIEPRSILDNGDREG